jgi:hypothetical protein
MTSLRLDDVLEFAELLRADWPVVRARVRASGHPVCEGNDDGGDDATAAAAAAAAAGGDDSDDDGDDAGSGDGDKPPTAAELARWRKESRKWEGRAKKDKERADELAAKLQEHEDAAKSDQEKAVDDAARQAREEALSEAQKERRADKLEMAVVRLGSVTGVKVGDGDDAKVVKFADPDDVQGWLERQIAKGDIDAEDIYKDGRVDEDALAVELVRLAVAKPRWLEGTMKNGGTPAGSADAGRGAAPAGNSVEAELKAVQRRRHSVTT